MFITVRTDIGKVREINQDFAWVGKLPNKRIAAIVADGLGGHLAGDVASQMTVEFLVSSLQKWALERTDQTLVQEKEQFHLMLRQANQKVFQSSCEKEEYNGMGTTVVMAVVQEFSVLLAHIGDSRIYRFHDHKLIQLTEDHTLVNELVKSGQILPQQLEDHPQKNVLSRALGTNADIKADIQHLVWENGDVLLLCSDGLSGFVSAEEIKNTLEKKISLEQQADRLVGLALEAGGLDNVTVALIKCESEEGKSNDRV